MGPEQRFKLRPDILLVKREPRKRSRGASRANLPGTQTIWIIEVGYCSDTRYREKLQQKMEQHTVLKTILLSKGHTVRYLPIILGNAGCTYKSGEQALLDLGISRSNVQKLHTRLMEHAISYLHRIVRTRRQLEHSCSHPRRPPDPA